MKTTQTHKEIHKFRDKFGVPCGSLEGIRLQFKQLRKNGLSIKQVQDALTNLHPRLMKNLRVDRYGSISIKDPTRIWIRRNEWLPPGSRR